MLNRKNRLTKNRYFQYIYKNGKKVYGKNFYLVYLSTKIRPCKVGIVVSNKVGKAVVRNKVKRRIRAVIREMISNVSNSNNYIVVAKPEVCVLTYVQIKDELESIFKKGEFLNAKNN